MDAGIDNTILYVNRPYAVEWKISTFLMYAYPLLCPLLVIPGNTLIGASDILFVPAFLSILVAGTFRRPQLEHICFMFFLGACLASVFAVEDSGVFQRILLKWVRLVSVCLPLYLPLFVKLDVGSGSRIMRLFDAAGFLAIVAGLVLFHLQIEIPGAANQRLWSEGRYVFRAGGLYGNTMYFGQIVTCWTVLRCSRLAQRLEDRLSFWSIFFSVLLSGYCVYASSSRAAFLGIAVGLAMIGIVNFRRMLSLPISTISYLALSMFMVVVALLLAVAMSGVDLTGSDVWQANLSRFSIAGIEERGLQGASSGRIQIWSSYFERLTSSETWRGIGYGTSDDRFGTDAHNGILTILAETGLSGILAIFSFVFVVLFRLVGQSFRGVSFSQIVLPVIVSIMMGSLTGTVFHAWAAMPVVYLLVAVASSEVAEEM